MNSFELVYNVVDGDVIIDRDYYAIKEEQFKQVFSDMDFLGWYTSGDVVDDRDIKIHKQICEINESPVLLKLNPTARHSDVSIKFCNFFIIECKFFKIFFVAPCYNV